MWGVLLFSHSFFLFNTKIRDLVDPKKIKKKSQTEKKKGQGFLFEDRFIFVQKKTALTQLVNKSDKPWTIKVAIPVNKIGVHASSDESAFELTDNEEKKTWTFFIVAGGTSVRDEWVNTVTSLMRGWAAK